MVKTLDGGFRLFLEEIAYPKGEAGLAWDYQGQIEDCLDSYFGLYAFFRGGACLNGTGIRGYSNVDYFASLDQNRLPDDSTACLDLVKRAFDERLPQADARVKQPAVMIAAGEEGCRTIRVIPAKLAGQTSSGYRVYQVPDGAGGWMVSSPDARRAIIDTVDRELDGKLIPLIRLVKAWKYFRVVPISSFYLELRCTQYAAGEQMLVYSVDFGLVLQRIWDDQFEDARDLRGIAGVVSARLAQADREVAISRLRAALYHVGRAQDAAAEGDMAETFRYWNRVFNGHFPAYG